MAELATPYEARNYLDRSFERKGIGGWRKLYLAFIEELAPHTIAEFGAGSPDFLSQIEARRRVAVDVGTRFAGEFSRLGIEFVERDLERDTSLDLGLVDVAVCSDVFEHLIHPARALSRIAETLRPAGILFSHVPNEFRLGHQLAVMMGKRESVLFHEGSKEWDDPHFRRFSDTGFRAFLTQRFAHNLVLTDLRYGGAARWLRTFGVRVPYCLQGGPTYASTNDRATYERLRELKSGFAHA